MNATAILDIKAQVRERDGNRCAKCGMTKEEHLTQYGTILEVHRTTPGSEYSLDPGACITICRRCHSDEPKRPRGTYPNGPVLFLRMGKDTEDAIQAFIASQVVPPDRTAVGLSALHEFLAKHGFWPPKRSG